MGLKEELRQFAYSIGLDHLGVGSVEPFERTKKLLEEQQETDTYPLFTEKDIELRCHPEDILPGARTLISVAISYLTDDPGHPPRHDDAPRAIVSRYCWGEDYHNLLPRKLEAIIDFLKERVPDAEFAPFVDTGPPVDRSVAERAGIGWFGKNAMIYVPNHGSWVFLGEILTTIEIEPDPPIGKSCGTCTKCITACPTNAIIEPYRIDPTRCLSQITQMGGWIPREFRKPMGRRLFGCDTCQAVCPWNWEAAPTNREFFRPDRALTSRPELIPLLTMTKRDFRRLFHHTPMGWRGKKIIERNACIALGNIGDPKAVPALVDRLENDPKPLVRGTAAWALGQIGGEEAKRALQLALEKESDGEAKEEIRLALLDIDQRATSISPYSDDSGHPIHA